MGRIRGVLLDIDGTLVDSNDAHAHAWVEALAEQNITVPFAEVRRRIGMGGDKLLPDVTGIAEDTEPGKKISKRRGEIFLTRYLPLLNPTRGANQLLHHLKEQGFTLAIATSAKEEEMKALLKVCGADGVIDARTSSDDAENSKPDPDILQAAHEQIGLPAEDVVLLGDTPYDVEAARRAGVRTVALRCGGWTDKDLAGALAVYQDPADLLARYYASPLSHR